MKLATLKKLERAAYAMVKAVEEEAKRDPIAKSLHEACNKLWHERYTAFNTANNVAASKKDKGEILFTVFVPERHCLVERIRTPFRTITKHHWRRSYPEPHYEQTGEGHIEILAGKLSQRFYPPKYHFEYWMKAAA